MKFVKLSELSNYFIRRTLKEGKNLADFCQLVQKKMKWNKSIWAQ